jgi:peroxidase
MKTKHVLQATFCLMGMAMTANAQQQQPPPPPQGGANQQPPMPRPRQRPPTPPPGNNPGGPAVPMDFPIEFRTYDGTANNSRDWGMAETEYLRKSRPAYADGANTPSGPTRPNARAISNAMAAQSESRPAMHGESDYMWVWGQFLDHDLDETPTIDPPEAFNISVPIGDASFDPTSTGTQVIPLNRSYYNLIKGVREQVNAITAFIDASQVYGSDARRAEALRTLDGTGRMKTSEGNLLPFNVDGLENVPSSQIPSLFVAGDVRVNEQVGLIALHTVFLREHNYWADTLRAANSAMSDEELYQSARCIVAAEMQAITWREFLPVLLGPKWAGPYRGYRSTVNAGISTEFGVAAYRLGHSMVNSQVLRLDASLQEIAGGHLSLKNAFFSLQPILDDGIDPILRGFAFQRSQDVDNLVIDDLRNFLFGAPGAGGMDLPALNIQRGRDHGVGSLNQVRQAMRLRPYRTLAEINRDAEVQSRLAAAYTNVNDVDLWIGGLAEPHLPGAMVGSTFFAILKDQFNRLRDGDRFWYERYLTKPMVEMINAQSLDVILRRNTGIGAELPRNVWRVPPPPGQNPPPNQGGPGGNQPPPNGGPGGNQPPPPPQQ